MTIDDVMRGDRITECRLAMGLSEKELAERAGLTETVVDEMTRGLEGSAGAIIAIAKVLKVKALWLETGLGESEAVLRPLAYQWAVDLDRDDEPRVLH